jgi:hypothetical protein
VTGSDGDPTREEPPDELADYETVARLLQADQGCGCGEAREAAIDRVEPDELLEPSRVLARSLGTGDGVQRREPGERAVAPDESVTDEELYRPRPRAGGAGAAVRHPLDRALGDLGGGPSLVSPLDDLMDALERRGLLLPLGSDVLVGVLPAVRGHSSPTGLGTNSCLEKSGSSVSRPAGALYPVPYPLVSVRRNDWSGRGRPAGRRPWR